MMPRADRDTSRHFFFDELAQRLCDCTGCCFTIRERVVDDVVVKPPLRVEEDQPQSSNVHGSRTRAPIDREHFDIAPGRHRRDHFFLQPDRKKSECRPRLAAPVVISWNEDSAYALWNRIHLRLESPARIRVLGLPFFGNSVRINVVAEENDYCSCRYLSRLRGKRVEYQ